MILKKPENAATKEMCILALTKIYCMTRQYQTLVREITTPTLPTFVTSCLNIISTKSSAKSLAAPSSLIEAIFRSFVTLLPNYSTIYRPYISQIRIIAKPYLAPTHEDSFVPSSLSQSARCLVAAIHQAVAKGAGGEEWGKALRELIKGVHVTGDQVFRAVVEDWESVAGYVGNTVDVNTELSGGGQTSDDLPRWSGISNGVERIVGLLGVLQEYLSNETPTSVTLPLGAIIDMTTRLLSIAVPSPSQTESSYSKSRLHPAIDRDERDGLWSGLPSIYVATLSLIGTVVDRVEESFLSLAPTLFENLGWAFPSGKHDPTFRLVAYLVLSKILLRGGQVLSKKQMSKLYMVIRSCCNDLIASGHDSIGDPKDVINANGKRAHHHDHNANNILQPLIDPVHGLHTGDTELVIAASDLLPLLMSHVSSEYLDVSMRSLLERTAILTHNKRAMVSSVLYPYIGKNGKAITSLLPHLARAFHDDSAVELLLRPHLPMVPSGITILPYEDGASESVGNEDDDMEMHHESSEAYIDSAPQHVEPDANFDVPNGLGSSIIPKLITGLGMGGSFPSNPSPPGSFPEARHTLGQVLAGESSAPQNATMELDRVGVVDAGPKPQATVGLLDENTDSDDGSIHLIMGLDTDSSDSDG